MTIQNPGLRGSIYGVNPMQEHVESLATSSLHRFADWPNCAIPEVCAGVYAIYERSGKFIYIGMAGKKLTEEAIEEKQAAGKRSGLFDRLNSHASGYRSGDQFNIYISDVYVLRTLSKNDIAGISSGTKSFNALVKEFIRAELSYRYVVVPNTVVKKLEEYIQAKGIKGELPVINGRGQQSNE